MTEQSKPLTDNRSQPDSTAADVGTKKKRLWWPVRWLLKSSLGLIILVILLVLLIGGLLFTNPGLKTIVWGAQKALPQLSVEDSEGALLREFTLTNVRFSDESLGVDTKFGQLQLGVNVECALRLSICVEKLVAKQGYLKLYDTGAPVEPEPEPADDDPSLIFVPIPIEVGLISLDDIELDVFGIGIDWNSLHTSGGFFGSKLTLLPSAISGLTLSLPPAQEEPESESAEAEVVEAGPIILPDVHIPLEIDIKKLELTQFEYQAETPIVVNRAMLIGQVGGYDIGVEQFELEMPEVDATLQGDIRLEADYPLNLHLNATVLHPELKGQTVDLSVNNSVADLDLDLTLSNLLSGHFAGNLQPLDPDLPFDLAIKDVDAFWPLFSGPEYQASISSLVTKGSLDGFSIELVGAVDGTVVPATELDLRGSGDLSHIDLTQLTVGVLGGEIQGTASADWSTLVNWQAELAFEQLQPGLEWPEAEGEVSGRLRTDGTLTDAGGWKVSLPLLDIDGILREYPLNLEGSVDVSDVAGAGDLYVDIPSLSLSHADNRVQVSGQIDKLWDLALNLNFVDLAASVPDALGRIQGEVLIGGALEEPDLQVDLNVNQFAFKDIATLNSLSLKGDLTPLPSPSGDISLNVNQLQVNQQDIDSIALGFVGSQDQHTLRLDIQSEMVSGGLSIRGGLKLEPDLNWSGALFDAHFKTLQGEWRLDHEPKLGYDMATNVANVDAHCWLQAQSKVCLDNDVVAGESGEASLSVNEFNFEQLAAFIPKGTELDGLLNLQAQAKWAPGTPIEAQATLTLPTGKVTQKLEPDLVVGWEQISAKVMLADNNLRSEWAIDLTENGQVKGYANLDDVLNDSRDIDANIVIEEINLSPLQPLVGEFSRVGALIESDIELKGPMLKPKAQGYFAINDIQVAGDITPVEVSNGEFRVDFTGYQAALNSRIDTAEGSLEIKGEADWTDTEDWYTKLNIFAEELLVSVDPILVASVEPDLNISIVPGNIKVDGKVALPYGRITVQSLPESAVSLSSDEVLLDEDLQPLEEQSEIPFNIETNINVVIGDDFRLSAFGLRGSLVGDLSVTQKDQAPFIIGEVNIVDGAYRALGQDLVISEGKILFNGPADQPYLAVTAIRNPDNTQDDVTAGVRVSGPADEPEVIIFSDPSMPQANALSYVLRGQNLDAESSGDAMTTALIGLSLARSGKVVGEIGEVFGVQDLQLDTEGSGDDSQVTVSGYILPGLQVKYGMGIFESIGEFTVRYRIAKDLYVEAVSGADNALDVLYQFQFD
ncbi:autotransporter assembly complex protein TamB [Vibrio ulleungensis]|uniref:Translocation/assembly module TamB n=1 Tax=Vibrio ulleungensis TaxID=2807619 RepID=A0ABS2HIH9_9VIBR|nr:translocation/assembly module TamB domain-containing protein [Vibrio ulleungensis]MBM7037333.1 translocation/assembly module TamB [Vibrio ulleungensis]